MKTRKLTHSATLICATLGAAVGLGATDAMAAAQATRSVTVNYGDVNLATLAGASTLYERLQGAARTVCGDQGRRMAELRDWEDCYHGAIDGAVAAVNNPIVTAIHRRQSG
jgi:UrcA family protein